MLGTTLGVAYGITPGIDEGTELGSSDGSSDGSNGGTVLGASEGFFKRELVMSFLRDQNWDSHLDLPMVKCLALKKASY